MRTESGRNEDFRRGMRNGVAGVPDEPSRPDTAALTAELVTWRKRMFRVLKPVRDQFPELYRLTHDAEPPTTWATSDYLLIRTFLIQALDHTEQTRSGTQPADAYSPAVLRRVFGLTEDTANATVKERQTAASEQIPDVYTHYDLAEPEVRAPQVTALIAAIDAWHAAKKLAGGTGATHGSGTSDKGEPRRLYGRSADLAWLAQNRNQLKDAGGLFGIWGLDGIGKTALAEQFAWTIGLERTATIRIGQPGRYAQDLRATLIRAGHAVGAASTEQYEAEFRTHVSNLADLWLLVLDGVTDPDDLDRIGVDQARIPVLVVSGQRFTAGLGQERSDAMPWRQVGPLDRDASVDLLTQHMPHNWRSDRDTTSDMQELAELAGGHAATLETVGRLLPSLTQHDIWELLQQVSREPRESLTAIGHFTGDRGLRAAATPLSWIIRNKLDQLSDEPVPRTVVTVLACCSHMGRMPRELIDATVPEVLGRSVWNRELDFAYDRLARLGLATLEGDELVSEQLVCHITRYEIIDRLTPVLLAYERVAARPADRTISRFGPLNLLRQEYLKASGAGLGSGQWFEATGDGRLLRIGAGGDYWARYRTGEDGVRTVSLYRPGGPDCVLRFAGSPPDGWTQVTDSEFEQFHSAVNDYYIRIMRRILVPLEKEFGPNRAAWPQEVEAAAESYA